MSDTYQNLCFRCGKVRIVTRIWEEKVGYSTVTNTETKCPDPECQKMIDKDIKKQKDRRSQMEKRKKESFKNRLSLAAAAKLKQI